MNPQPILILSASAGAGHTVAARAIEAAVRRLAPAETVEVHDLLQSTNGLFSRLYANGYLGLARHAPTILGLIYESTDHPRPVADVLRRAFQHANSAGARRYVLHKRPKLIINTHFYSAEVVARLRCAGRLNCPQVTVTTDFDTHRMWVQPPTERYYAATTDGKDYLAILGVPPDNIKVTGIPIRPSFALDVDRAAFRARHGFDARRPLVLLLGGGFGVGPTEALFRQLLDLRRDVQIAAIAGRNEPLRRRLERAAVGARHPVRVIGFTDEMHAWMRSVDLAVSKPGGLTASEALCCGLPLLIVYPIPGQETRNSDYLLEQNAAIKVNNYRMLARRVENLLDDRARLARLRSAGLAVARPNAAEEIVADALQLIGWRPPAATREPELVQRA